MGPATKIYSLLTNDVLIKYSEWTASWDTTLELFTWGRTKLYDDEKVLEECTVEDIVALLTFERGNGLIEDEKNEMDLDVDGVFVRFANSEMFSFDFNEMSKINKWRETVVKWIRTGQVDGRILKSESVQLLAAEIATILLPSAEEERNALHAPCTIILKLCKQCPVHCILEMAAKLSAKQSDVEQRWRSIGRVAGILGRSVIRSLTIARENILETRRLESALMIQKYLRSATERAKYVERVAAVRGAVNLIWTCYRGLQQRNALHLWLDQRVKETRLRKKITRFDALKQFVLQQHDVEEKEIDILNAMVFDDGFESDTLQLSEMLMIYEKLPWCQLRCAQFIPDFFRARQRMYIIVLFKYTLR